MSMIATSSCTDAGKTVAVTMNQLDDVLGEVEHRKSPPLKFSSLVLKNRATATNDHVAEQRARKPARPDAGESSGPRSSH
jgi:hypothetical protein